MSWNRIQGHIPWGKFLKATFGISVSILLLQLALFLAQLPIQLHQASLATLGISLLIILFSIHALWIWIQSLTAFSIVKFLFTLYIISVLVMAIATTQEGDFTRAFLRAALQIPSTAAQFSFRSLASILEYPSSFSNAYNGQNSNASMDAITANESVLLTVKIPVLTSGAKSSIAVGMLITVNNEAKKFCQLDAMSDETFFTIRDVLVTDGPRYEDGMAKWRLRNEVGSAWCADDVLSMP
jgi:lysylphosphatidylglycerol synthetase-like protein (DUF2156 family)